MVKDGRRGPDVQSPRDRWGGSTWTSHRKDPHRRGGEDTGAVRPGAKKVFRLVSEPPRVRVFLCRVGGVTPRPLRLVTAGRRMYADSSDATLNDPESCGPVSNSPARTAPSEVHRRGSQARPRTPCSDSRCPIKGSAPSGWGLPVRAPRSPRPDSDTRKSDVQDLLRHPRDYMVW